MTDPHPAPTPADAPSPTPATPLWPTIEALWSRLEEAGGPGGREGVLLRVLKLSEEVGEVAEALIGATGQNPRKGVTHTWSDVESELCDVAITALVALRTLTPTPEATFTTHLTRVRDRPQTPR
ncbi:MazG-like family protein [Streptomyces sp. J2-1]|uniref:MazG-like family protein n=1 Tax=Streptomyces corallincola TaxID=2851888 RepID=UPI001C38F6D5|nr:MazG-like family protein [Streptomyces corallincola]MBV2353709.1 MazG-like family protein [Streptomyces corallincola]